MQRVSAVKTPLISCKLRAVSFLTGVVICLLPFALHGQITNPHLIDSLERQLHNPAIKNDSNKVKTLCSLALAYQPVNYNVAFDNAQKALVLAEKINWAKGTGLALHAIGKSYWAKSDYLNALESYQKALEILTLAGDGYNTVIVLKSIGSANYAEQHYDKAAEYFEKAWPIAEKLDENPRLQLIYGEFGLATALASTYASKGEFKTSVYYANKAVIANKEAGKELEAAHIIPDLAEYKYYFNRSTEAEADVLQALTICKHYDDAVGQGKCYECLGWMRTMKLDYTGAVAYFKNAVAAYGKVSDAGHIARNYSSVGRTYLDMAAIAPDDNEQAKKDLLTEAAANLEKAVDIGHAINSWIDLQGYEKDLSDIYEMQGDYVKANKALKRYNMYKDSLESTATRQKYTRQLLQYEYDKQKDSLNYVNKLQQTKLLSLEQENELSRLKQRQQLLYTLSGITVLGLLASVLIFRTRLQRLNLKNELAREKSDKMLKESEFKSRMNDITFSALRSQMNPHFIFNCLNSIKLYTEQNNSEAASEYLTKFSKLIRRILDSARADNITLASEIELLGLYLEMEGMRFKEKLKYHIEIDKGIDTDFIDIPPLLIQPYVENAIWHGLMHKDEGGTITIHIGMEDGQVLVIMVEDDGIGIEKAEALKSKTAIQHKSFGTKLTAERIALINEKYQTSARVIITNLYDAYNNACGTRVTIKLPVK